MKWIYTGDIKNWVNGQQRHCAQTLPELIRRLIFATANSIDEIDFPSGDSIATGGWDGRLKTPVISPFFPNDASGWEIGAEKSAETKAESDYTKRTADYLGLPPKDTTFVFVTPRPWPGRVKWQNNKRASGTWKDVRVINVDGLEQWLDSAPAVALWLAHQIGKVVSDGIRDIESVWKEWSLATNPRMTTDLVISGRKEEMEEIHKWITQKPRIHEVKRDSPDEAFAFLYAAINALPETERAKTLARCIVVESISKLRECIQAFQNPLIIAAPSQCIKVAGAAIEKGHHIFLNLEKLDKQLETPDLEITEEVVPFPLLLRDNTGEGHIEARRIKVINKGKIAAENVYGIIEDLNTSKKLESRISWHEGENDVPYTTINAGDHMFLNIYGIIMRRSSKYLVSKTDDITIATENGWKWHHLISTDLDLKFAIRVTAKNASPKRKIFKISRNNDLELEFLNED